MYSIVSVQQSPWLDESLIDRRDSFERFDAELPISNVSLASRRKRLGSIVVYRQRSYFQATYFTLQIEE